MAAQSSQGWDRWNGYYYLFGEDERCVVTFNVYACEPQHQRPSCGRRLIGFTPDEYISPQGMPMGVAFERLKAIEARMTTLLAQHGVACWHVGKQVYRGMRELLYQVDPPHVAVFERVCAQIEAELGGTKVVPYEGWQFFNDKIRPGDDARSHISNRELLEAIKGHGADMSREYILDHTFVGEGPGLAEVKETLEAEGFRSMGSTERHVTLSASAALDQDEIDGLTRRLRRLAKECGVLYDGWGTALR